MNRFLLWISDSTMAGAIVPAYYGHYDVSASLFAAGVLLFALATISETRKELKLYRNLRFMRIPRGDK